MPTERSLNGYSLGDLYIRIIPGSLVVIPLMMTIAILSGNGLGLFFPLTATDMVVLVIVSLLAGEILNYLSQAGGRSPRSFRLQLYTETDRTDLLIQRDRQRVSEKQVNNNRKKYLWKMYLYFLEILPIFHKRPRVRRHVFCFQEKDFVETVESDFELEIDEKCDEEERSAIPADRIYHLVLSKTWPSMSPITRRYFYLNKFVSNIELVEKFVLMMVIIYASFALLGFGDAASNIFTVLLLLIAIPVITVFRIGFADIEARYIVLLIDDYYQSHMEY